MNAKREINLEKELKLRSDAINRLILDHDEELREYDDLIASSRCVIRNLTAVIVVLLVVCGYAGYALYTKGKTTDVVVQPASKDNAYVLRRNK